MMSKNSVDKDFVTRSCLVLTDLDSQYNVGNFTTSNLKLIEASWKKIKISLEDTLRIVNRFGIDRETLTSLNALLPIAYYIHRIGRGSLDGSTPFEATNSRRVHHWLLVSLLYGIFGGNSDDTIRQSRAIIQEKLKTSLDFPYRALAQGLRLRGRVRAEFDEDNIERVLETGYGKRTCFLALSLLYDSSNWGSTQHHVDHIIPRSLADRKSLLEMNLAEPTISRILDSVNRLGNLQILLGRENLEKSDIPFGRWIKTRDREFLDHQLIPNSPDLWEVTALPQFVEAREELIRQRLRLLAFEPVERSDQSATSKALEGAQGN